MEIMNPIAIVIFLVISVVICFYKFKKKIKYTDGKKVANTKYIRETEYYKNKMRRYKILSNVVKALSVISVLITSILVSRPVTVQTQSDEKYNRDVLLGLDISLSENEVNLELLKKFRKIIPDIEGDRIGLVLYNTAPVVFCPLTDDYDYINECLDTIQEQLELAQDTDLNPPVTYEVDGVEVPTIWYGGTVLDSDVKGSSLVGDGLARNIIFISRFKKRCSKN